MQHESLVQYLNVDTVQLDSSHVYFNFHKQPGDSLVSKLVLFLMNSSLGNISAFEIPLRPLLYSLPIKSYKIGI